MLLYRPPPERANPVPKIGLLFCVKGCASIGCVAGPDSDVLQDRVNDVEGPSPYPILRLGDKPVSRDLYQNFLQHTAADRCIELHVDGASVFRRGKRLFLEHRTSVYAVVKEQRRCGYRSALEQGE